MGSPRRYTALALLALAVPAYADPADPVVVEVGTAHLTASAVQQRIDAIPDFQRRTFGKTEAEIRRHVVDAILVPELLFAEHARATDLAAVPHVRLRLREALARALGDALEHEAASETVADTDLRAYYDAHLDDYVQPERIRIARILVDDEAAAKKILSDVTGIKGPELWKNLARESSLDEATKLRGGMLGFVYPDGHTDVPQVAVDPALYAAAARVKNGELVPTPVKEAGHLGVIWRRGSLPATSRSFESERDAIRVILVRERAERALATLSDELRHKYVTDEHPALLETLDKRSAPGASDSAFVPAPPPSTSADPFPRPTDRGLR
ncbi:MAG TPA: peptidyl-prolyl cis-trans isomerase [Polyangiaceae bacterium]|jgi:peptidyl-prolyl cis-trans isomerase C|nr:peptidyl-prolyl cis-trans isomerase [Polyangiaceae bacterium]